MADDLSTLSDADLDAAIAAQQNNAAVSSAILSQESGNNPDSPSSVDGAVGMGQIMPATFAQYAKPGEDINNPADNLAVHQRIIADLAKKANGDPARIAVGYFSGPGNIAPPDSPTPYKNDHKDGNGKSVSSYVSDVLGRMNPISDAAAEPAPASAADPLTKLSDADLDAQIEKLQGAQTPPLTGFAKRMSDDWNQRKANDQKSYDMYKSGQQSALATGIRGLGEGAGIVGDVAGNIVGSGVRSVYDASVDPRSNADFVAAKNFAVDHLKSDDDSPGMISRGIDYANKNYPVSMGLGQAGLNMLGVIPAADGLGGALKLGEGVAGQANKLPVLGPLLSDTASTSGPIASASKILAAKAAPIVPAQTGQLVRDAQGLGIDIPASTFDPGRTSSVLSKVGLMAEKDPKSQITTALSKEMGHAGTANLDVPTMENIQDTIGAKMDNFALKADANGGIPVAESDLENIADDSFADENKVNKLIAKIKDRMQTDPNGQTYLSGDDYQALTQKKGILSKAMKSTDSDFSDTASDIRDHLDSMLQKTVSPSDLADFQKARQQYRTMKIIQPLVESGGVSGQPDSAARLYNAIAGKQGYGSLKNALAYNPNLGKIAQIANEYPELLKDVPKTGFIGKAAKIATAPAAIGIGAVGGTPLGIAAGATLPVAKGVGTYLSSPFYKEAILKNSGFKKGGVVKNPLA